MHYLPSVEFHQELYDFEQYADFVPMLDNHYHRILIVGHNPAIGEFANKLVGEQDFIAKFPTGTFCELYWKSVESGRSWSDTIRGNHAKVRWFLSPKDTVEK